MHRSNSERMVLGILIEGKRLFHDEFIVGLVKSVPVLSADPGQGYRAGNNGAEAGGRRPDLVAPGLPGDAEGGQVLAVVPDHGVVSPLQETPSPADGLFAGQAGFVVPPAELSSLEELLQPGLRDRRSGLLL